MRLGALVIALIGLSACGPTKGTGLPIGSPCAPTVAPGETAPDCADGLCVALDSASGFCTRNCTSDDRCPDGFLCVAAGRFGKVCKQNDGCKEDVDCPAGHSCNADSGNCFIKVSRILCSPCQDAQQCPTGGSCFSALGSGEQFCTAPCGASDACPGGFTCTEIPVGPDKVPTKQCVPVTQSCNFGKTICSPCSGDAECGGPFDLCVRNVVSGEQFCGRDCNPKKNVCPTEGCDPESLDSAQNPECPTGFSCTNIGKSDDPNVKGPFQCVPNSNTCVGYCNATDEAAQLAQCGLGKSCANEVCVPSSDGRECSPCGSNDDCRRGSHPENRCIVNNCPSCPFKGESFCATPCADDAACVDSFGPGFVCNEVTDVTGAKKKYCIPQRGTCQSGLGRLGADCSQGGAADCLAGVCLKAGLSATCSLPCSKDAQCGDTRYRCCEYGANGYDCADDKRMADGPKNGSGVCAPLGGLFGDDCTPGRPPCQTGTCLDLGTARVCSLTCAGGATCPSGFTCRKAQLPMMSGQLDVCFPAGGGQPGADCAFGPAACESGLCIRKDSGPICTVSCRDGAACPEDWACQTVRTVTNDPIEACVPPSLL